MRPRIDPRPLYRAAPSARACALALSLLLLSLIAALPAVAGPVELLSRAALVSDTAGNPEPFLVLPEAALSADGRYAAIAIGSFNLSPGQSDANQAKDLFLFDRVAGTRTLVSHAAGAPAVAGSGASDRPAISADGRFVAFRSQATDLIAGQVEGNGGSDVFLWDRTTGDLLLVSHAAAAAGTTGNATAEELALSADGRYVAFASEALDLIAGGDDENAASDVFLWDRETGETVLVSHASGSATTAAAGTSTSVTISTDGRYVAYLSDAADLVPGQSEPVAGSNDVFLYDRVAGTTTLASHAAGAATTASGDSSRPVVSGDGSHVLFTSNATDLVPGQIDSPSTDDVFLWDRAADATVLVSRSAASPTTPGNGPSLGWATSADGAWVAFTSAATDLVPGQVETNASADLFLFDRDAGTTTLASHTTASPLTATAEGVEEAVVLSADGRFLAFTSTAPDLAAGQGEPAGDLDLFVFDREGGAVALASHAAGSPAAANARSRGPAISADGAWIVFASLATDLVAGLADLNDNNDLFLHDRAAGTNEAITRHDPGLASLTPDGTSFAPEDAVSAVSADGRYAAFLSDSPHLVSGQVDGNGGVDVFLFDRLAGTTTLVSHASGSPSAAGNGASEQPAVSADGRYVAFLSFATNLVPGQTDGNGARDLFLYDRVAGTTLLVSHASGSPTAAAAGESSAAAIDGEGRYLAFASTATDLVPSQADTPGQSDVFLFDRAAGTTRLASHADSSAATAGDGASDHPSVSADGRYVAFDSFATNLAPAQADGNSATDVFVWDRDTGATTLVSRAFDTPNGAALGGSSLPTISRDGAFVAYLSEALDLVAGEVPGDFGPDVFLFDRAAGTNLLVSRVDGSTSTGGGGVCFNFFGCLPPALSADGRYVAFSTIATNLVPGQVDDADSIDAFLFDRLTGTTLLASHGSDFPTLAVGAHLSRVPALSADGRFLAFVGGDGVVPGQSGPLHANVFLFDRLSGTNALASHRPGSATTTGAGDSFDPLLSADGGTLVFTSLAPDLVAGDFNARADVFAYVNPAAVAPTGAFFTLVPCRLLDSREPGQGPAFVSEQAEVLTLKGNCGIPASARALSVNVTVTQPTGPGHLTLYPGDQTPPFASTINFDAGETRANNAILSLATNGAGTLTIRPFLVDGGTVHVILDVNGYFE